jgi:hypothetical protein
MTGKTPTQEAEEWEKDDEFFQEIDPGTGLSKRKQKFKEDCSRRVHPSTPADPALSAEEARRKIRALVRARAGLESEEFPRTKRQKLEAKFSRKDQRFKERAIDQVKFKKVRRANESLKKISKNIRKRR